MATERKHAIRKILIIRVRQIGDAVLATALCTTLKRSFPQAEVHFILNREIAPLFEGHPDIDRIITFERKQTPAAYFRQVRNVVAGRYDVIIDMRSTMKSLLFSVLSLRTPYRIGRGKWYSRLILTHSIPEAELLRMPMIDQDLSFARALEAEGTINYTREFKLLPADHERDQFRAFMISQGIDISRPIMLVAVTAKLAEKRWNQAFMKTVIENILHTFPRFQLIFNYAPGEEENDAHAMYDALQRPAAVFIGVRARSLRELAALCSCVDFYFGNEGGARHIAHSFGVPSFAIMSPGTTKHEWLPQNDVPATGIECEDVLTAGQMKHMSRTEWYDAITPDIVWARLKPLLGTRYYV